MNFSRDVRVAAGLSLVMLVASAEARARSGPQKVRLRFDATGTLIRGTFGTNQDMYLAETASPGDNGVLLQLIDEYPNEYPPLSVEVLKEASGAVLRVRRDSSCDAAYGQLVLRTAPGDPMAILPVKLAYIPHFDKVPEASTIVPCYRVVR